MANQNYPQSRIWSGEYFPVMINARFTVNPSDSAGYGVTGLKGAYIKNVFMHTSATPAAGNPNPASGYIMIQLTDNFNSYISSYSSIVSPNSGSNVAISGSSLTVGQVYVISVVGTSTAADWVALGVPVGITPAVGVSFVAAASGAGSGSGQVQLPGAAGSGIDHIEIVGDPNQMVAPMQGINTKITGSYFMFQCLAATSSSVTTLVAAAPASGSVINIQMLMSNSYLKINGM